MDYKYIPICNDDAFKGFSTYTGRSIDLANFGVDDICLDDIAHSLANQCRFGGHSRQFYSVAQHSFHTSHIVQRRMSEKNLTNPQTLVWALLHDATEAYLIDLPRPVKQLMTTDEYRRLEIKFRQVIADKYDLTWHNRLGYPRLVDEVDNHILESEWMQLLYRGDGYPDHIVRSKKMLLDLGIEGCWSPDKAAYKFKERFQQLWLNMEKTGL